MLNTTVRQLNDFAPETRSLLRALSAAGCTIISGSNGEDRFKFTGDLPHFVENLIACDEGWVKVRTPDGSVCSLYLVLGNSPGELVCDYSVNPVLDTVTEAHYDKWSERKQPTKDCPLDLARINRRVNNEAILCEQ